MSKIRFIFHSTLLLPSTIIHELLHAFIAIIFMIFDLAINAIRAIFTIRAKPIVKIVGFNLVPNYLTKTLGSVSYTNASPTQSILINLAPLLSLLIVFIASIQLNYLSFNYINIQNISITNTYHYSHTDILIFIIFLQFFLAAKPSKQDIKNAFSEVISLRFLVEITLFSGLIYGYILYSDGQLFSFLKDISGGLIGQIKEAF